MYKAPLQQYVRYCHDWDGGRFYNAERDYWGRLADATRYSGNDPIQYRLGRYESFVSVADAKHLEEGDEVIKYLY